jgi:hypothetical protein
LVRWLLALLATTTLTHADPKRECHLHDAEIARTVTNVGCFDKTRSTDEHTYGYRVCLLRARNGVCSGVLWEWDGPPEATPMVLEVATCGSKDGPVTFRAAHPTASASGGKRSYLRVFRGKLSQRALRGTMREHDHVEPIVLKKVKEGFDPLAQIRQDTRSACGAP